MNAGAYIVLLHAELETYLEERVHEVLRLAEERWSKDRKTSRSLLAMCIYFGKSPGLPQTHSTKDHFSAVVVEAINSADAKIRSNNGIRQHNFVQLLCMVGFEIHRLDPLLVAELDTIGSIRGDHAHQSARLQFARKFDPFDITKKVANALGLLAKFDADFVLFRKHQFGH